LLRIRERRQANAELEIHGAQVRASCQEDMITGIQAVFGQQKP